MRGSVLVSCSDNMNLVNMEFLPIQRLAARDTTCEGGGGDLISINNNI